MFREEKKIMIDLATKLIKSGKLSAEQEYGVKVELDLLTTWVHTQHEWEKQAKDGAVVLIPKLYNMFVERMKDGRA